MTSPPLSETGPSPEADLEELIATLTPLAREAVIAEVEHSRTHREKGGSSMEDAIANAREARADSAWVKATADMDDAALIDYLIRTRAEAKRSAHLQDARAGCEYCAGRESYVFGFNPQPSPDTIRRWVHVKVGDDGHYGANCKRPEVWDALSLLPPEPK